MFKKALSIFLIFTLVFLFASCGADKDSSESNNNSNVFNPDAPTITQAADDAAGLVVVDDFLLSFGEYSEEFLILRRCYVALYLCLPVALEVL